MKMLLLMVACTVMIVISASCQTSMQLVDARQIAIKLNEQAYNYPPRSSTDIVKSVKRDNSYSGVGKLDCSSSLYGISTRQEVDDYLEKLGSYRAHDAY